MIHLVISASEAAGSALGAALRRRGGEVHRLTLAACDRGADDGRLADRLERLAARGAGAAVTVSYVLPDRDASSLTATSSSDWLALFDEVARRPWQALKAVAAGLAPCCARFLVVASPATSAGAAAPALEALAFLLAATVGIATNLVLANPADAASLIAVASTAPAGLLAGQLLIGEQPADELPNQMDAVPSRGRGAPLWPTRIVVTGGAGDIARAACEAIATRSNGPLHALLVDVEETRLDATCTALREKGIDAIALAGDLADPVLPDRVVATSRELFGGLDAVFSHAGVGRSDPVLTANDADFDVSFAVNLHATWNLANASRSLLAQSGGSFVVTGSIGGLRPGLAPPIYGASKAAALRLMEIMAAEWAPLGIRVNAVSPGSTLTPMNRLWSADSDTRRRAAAAYPMGRMAEPAEVGGAMAFLVGPDASYIAGHNLVVDGALSRLGHRKPGARA